MRGIEVALLLLEVVAVDERTVDRGLLLGNREELVGGQQRWLAATEVREHEPGSFETRVREMADLVLERAAVGFGGLLEAPAADVEEPPVVEAPEATVLDPPVAQVGAAMRAVPAEEAHLPGLVTEQHEVLAQHPHGKRRAARRNLTRQADRLPVAPHELTHRGAASDAGQPLVLLRAQHRVPASPAATGSARESSGASHRSIGPSPCSTSQSTTENV